MKHTDVFIVGAGPSGLTLANLLAQYGVSVRIIDKYPSPLKLSMAAAIHARTLEVLDTVGITNKMIAEGDKVNILTLRTLHKDSVRLDFSYLEDTRYPYILMIPQYRTEQLLIDNLESYGVTIGRKQVMTNFTRFEDHVSIDILDEQGNVEVATASYLIGADGAKSTVRKLLGFDFSGENYADPWVLFDADLEWSIPRNEMTFSSSDDGIYGVFPIPGESDHHFRVAYTQTHDERGNPIEPTLEEAQAMMKVVGVKGRIINPTSKFWIFNLQHRQVDNYRHGNVLLLGDAAHIHTPFGGQGLNLGVVDAFNLGWKLAMVIQGQSSDSLLDSYQEERYPIGEQVVRSTHFGASTMLLRQPSIKRTLREMVMPVLEKLIPAKKRIVHQMSQLAHHYKDASTVRGQDGNLRAGQRLPNYAYVDMDGTSDLHAHLDKNKHTLFIVGDAFDLADLAELIQTQYSSTVAVRLVRTSPTNDMPCPVLADVSKQLPLKNELAYLIRPDHMIGLINTVADLRAGVHQMFAKRV